MGMTEGVRRIAEERERQVEGEGWLPEHDDGYVHNELARAAMAYAYCAAFEHGAGTVQVPYWPGNWAFRWWKPSDDPIRNLEKAGALIAAEIDRRLRERAK